MSSFSQGKSSVSHTFWSKEIRQQNKFCCNIPAENLLHLHVLVQSSTLRLASTLLSTNLSVSSLTQLLEESTCSLQTPSNHGFQPTFPSVPSARRELWPLCRRQPATPEVAAGNYLFGTAGCAKGGGISHPLCPVNRSLLISTSCVPAESQELLLQQRSPWVSMRMGQAITTLRIWLFLPTTGTILVVGALIMLYALAAHVLSESIRTEQSANSATDGKRVCHSQYLCREQINHLSRIFPWKNK